MDLLAPVHFGAIIGIAGIFYNAAAALPLIVSLGMIAGRRGNARFCLWGAEKLLTLSLALSIAGPIYIIASYLGVVLAYPASGASIWAPLLESAGMPQTSSLTAWAVGAFFLYLAHASLRPVVLNFKAADDRYKIRQIRLPLIFALGSAFVFFLTFILINWPFAGLPDGLGWDRAVMAIFRNGCRHYFMAFSPAGAIALLYGLHIFRKNTLATEKQANASLRWCSAWAGAGYLPHALQNWGLLIGLGFRERLPMGIAGAMGTQVFSLILLSLAICCWAWSFVTARGRRLAAWIAFILLILSATAPSAAKIFN